MQQRPVALQLGGDQPSAGRDCNAGLDRRRRSRRGLRLPLQTAPVDLVDNRREDRDKAERHDPAGDEKQPHQLAAQALRRRIERRFVVSIGGGHA